MCSLESPHRGDSNEYSRHTIFNNKKENHPKLSQICSYGFFSQGIQKNEFESVVVNEPSVFEPLKVSVFSNLYTPYSFHHKLLIFRNINSLE